MGKNERKRKLVIKFSNLFKSADKNGVSLKDVQAIFISSVNTDYSKLKIKPKNVHTSNGRASKENQGVFEKVRFLKTYLFPVILVLGLISSSAVYYKEPILETFTRDVLPCLIESNLYAMEISRPLVNCNFCRALDSIPVEYNISTEDFITKYAYSSVPVLIRDSTNTWNAMSNFSFRFFKDLYTESEDILTTIEEECQFFPWNTNIETLRDVFNMSDARADLEEGETSWYIGWSNCDAQVKNVLRHHYQRPYFLPPDFESSSLDWIFMGWSGPGAYVHLDYVERPSWQAQISGTKTWTLVPTPECEDECKTFNVTVHKGDIFVVDTTVWYHATFIHPGEISISIGSEYD